MEHYDIFISYRRDGGFETAKHLNDLLVHDGYTVSFDIDTLREGDFDETLLKRIDQCVDFILVVDKHTFERTLDPNFDPKKDWLRTELAYALKLRKNIIPVLLSGVNGFPTNLPEDVADVATKNGPEYNKYYFDEFYRRLKSFLHCIPRNVVVNNHIKTSDMPKWFGIVITLVLIAILLLFVIPKKEEPSPNNKPTIIYENEQTLIAENGMIIDTEEAVDLGLPSGTLWASKNVGASKPFHYGNYYAWGEVGTKEYYSEDNYLFKDTASQSSLPETIIHTRYDAATSTWGKKWAMPSIEQKNELQKHCKWYWTSLKNIPGFVVEGPNHKMIFLPAGGCYFTSHGSFLQACTSICYYWTGEMDPNMQGRAATMIMAEDYEVYYDRNGDFADGKLIRPVYYETKK